MNIAQDNEFTRSLSKLGQTLPTPKAILVVSAHWLTEGTFVTSSELPDTIYDFYGFPEELYEIDYPAPGDPDLAEDIAVLMKKHSVGLDAEWGFDHASWSILHHMYPEHDIPLLELSLDMRQPAEDHYDLAKDLAPLRDQGVLIIGSGNIVHNLRLIDMQNVDAEPYWWAAEFDDHVKKLLNERRHEELIEYENICKTASFAVPEGGRSIPMDLNFDPTKISEMSVPTNDHYLPMLYIAALQGDDEGVSFVHESMQHASISMRCFGVGL